jgi:acetylglutamate kinase
MVIDDELKQIINDNKSLKVIASESADGELHAVFKQSLHVTEDGQLEFYEIMESSQNNKNMVNSIWFDKTVAINVLSTDRRSFEIKAIAVKAYVAGTYFEEKYRKVTDDGHYDLSTVWRLEVLEVNEKTYEKRVNEEIAKHPHFRHLDQLKK